MVVEWKRTTDIKTVIKRIKNQEPKIKIKPAMVYDVYECCIKEREHGQSKIKSTSTGKKMICREHGGDLITRYKKCKKCGKQVINNYLRKGNTCTHCRPDWMNNNTADDVVIEHERGRYCRSYIVEKYGCYLYHDCWTCTLFYPIFKGTGPPIKIKEKC